MPSNLKKILRSKRAKVTQNNLLTSLVSLNRDTLCIFFNYNCNLTKMTKRGCDRQSYSPGQYWWKRGWDFQTCRRTRFNEYNFTCKLSQISSTFYNHFFKTILFFFNFTNIFVLSCKQKNLHDLCPKLGPLGKHLPNPVYNQKNQKKYYFKKLLEIFCWNIPFLTREWNQNFFEFLGPSYNDGQCFRNALWHKEGEGKNNKMCPNLIILNL
jgi:hypothetical protein